MRFSLLERIACLVLTGALVGCPVSGNVNSGTLDLTVTEMASVDSSFNKGNNHSSRPWLSADGRYLAFESTASNLVPGDTNNVSDVFVRDLLLGKTERVSVRSNGSQLSSASTIPSLSADGNYVVFMNRDTDVDTPPFTNPGRYNIYRHDRTTRSTVLVSQTVGGVESDADSFNPVVSSNGTYVAYETGGSALVVTGGPNQIVRTKLDSSGNVVSHDLVSVKTGGGAVTGACQAPSISSDGTRVAFQTVASDLVSGASGSDLNATNDVYVRNLATSQTILVSANHYASPPVAAGDSDQPSMSADGALVAFKSQATDIIPVDVNGVADIFVRNLSTPSSSRVSVSSSGVPGNSTSELPYISGDGTVVAFVSDAVNLVSGDTNATQDVFVHHRSTATTQRVSVSTYGFEGAPGLSSLEVALSSDGRAVAFSSFAANLVGYDTNGSRDIFVRKPVRY